MRAAALALVLVGAVAALLMSTRAEERPRARAPEPTPAPAREAAVSGIAPPAPVQGCRDGIEDMDPLVQDRERDVAVLSVLFQATGIYAADWDAMVAEQQWLKSIAIVDAGERVTLVVPREQRAWMRLEYAHSRRGRHAVTLAACRHRQTFYSGGFTIDYARAPDEGRCAELIVYSARSRPVRVGLFDEACREA